MNAGDNLNYLSFLDKEETEINRIKFDYYARPLGIATISDAWGYLREGEEMMITGIISFSGY